MRVTQPLMENHKPLFIRTVNFKQCTFGTTPLVFTDAPIIVEQAADRVTIEVGFLPAVFQHACGLHSQSEFAPARLLPISDVVCTHLWNLN